jgi:hypothetical protein
VLSKVSVVVSVGNGLRDVHLVGTMARQSTMDRISAEKKKFKGFPMFFTFENFKRVFLDDLKQW